MLAGKEKILEKLAKNKEIILKLRISPNAPQTGWRGEMADGAWKIAVAATPEKGRANAVLVAFLAHELGARRKDLEIIAGASEKTKLVRVRI